jgi:hypothetical protein
MVQGVCHKVGTQHLQDSTCQQAPGSRACMHHRKCAHLLLILPILLECRQIEGRNCNQIDSFGNRSLCGFNRLDDQLREVQGGYGFRLWHLTHP